MSNPSGGRIVAPRPRTPVAPLERAPRFSVVIPAYQASATIGETVESVLAQTVPPHELIVSDDGSTDDLEHALAPFGDAVRLVRRPHGGIAAARNAGVEAAAGEFVLILDADDALLPRKLEALTALAVARPDLDLLSTDVFFETGGQRAGRFGAANPFAVSDQRTAIFRSCFVGWPAARRTRLLDVGGFDPALRSSQDWACWIRLILGGSAAGLYDEPLSIYRVHSKSITAPRVETLRERTEMLERTLADAEVTEAERATLGSVVAETRARATLADAEEALRDRRSDRRRLALSAARTPDLPLRRRAACAAAAAAPGLAGVWLRRSSRHSVLERSVPEEVA
jgi:hypothetical protein